MNLKDKLRNVQRFLSDHLYSLANPKPDAIIYGETHGRRNHVMEQVEGIRKHRPEYVLLESMDDAGPDNNFIKFYTSEEASEISDEYSDIARACGEVGAKLAGCDIDKVKVVKEQFNGSLSKFLQYAEDMREITMAMNIDKYCGKRKTDAPIIAIIGKNHLMEGSTIFPILDVNGIKYRFIKQKERKTNPIDLEREESEYIERIERFKEKLR